MAEEGGGGAAGELEVVGAGGVGEGVEDRGAAAAGDAASAECLQLFEVVE